MQAADLRRVDLNLLLTFLAVVDEGGVGKAARAMGRTQPAITTRLRQLEHSLGAPLFHRAGRQLVLSPIGRSIEPRIREALHQLGDALGAVGRASAEPAGVLRVGALPTLSVHRLAPALRRLTADWPRLGVQVQHGFTQPQITDLARGNLDVVFSVGPPPRDRRVRVEVLGRTRPVAVFSARAAAIPRGSLHVRRLESWELVLFGRVGDLFFDAVSNALERHGLRDRARIEVAHIQTLKALVAAGCGATILPDYTVVERELTTRPLDGLALVHPIWMATRSGSAPLPAVTELAKRVRQPDVR